ncbi:Tryptophan synthase alpha chain [Halomicronema hongdechloris C2206]|uniref:Tryptophan synthase alpha chain n=1 Tax=Halomicronema hongdechloris C2206 TaxID=1641165 RepID=A0A1Z3HMW0_9CYAN|nr:tryptophan synthase subunit alpha [Halomicronema hongdechloris]ASC71615.1 Tryptophan synthase alpha chain [Halomicronema hongdechloris C2206]
MNTITNRFAQLRAQRQCALIPFITAGDPNLATTQAAIQRLDRSGADLIELGVPYTDPLADGSVIQAAATRALRRGVYLDAVLDVVRAVSSDIQAPIILFTYYNLILNRGVQPFLQAIATAGAKGLVVPDLPIEEAEGLIEAAKVLDVDVTVILLVAPTSSHIRLRTIAQKSQGFIYLVSVTGVTGVRSQLQTGLQSLLAEMHTFTDKPIGVGFGISQPDQARQLQAWGADAVIVGSAFVQRLADSSPKTGLQAIEQLCQDLKQAISATAVSMS